MSNKDPPDRMISMKSNQSFHTLSRFSISGGHNFILKNSMGWPQVSIADLSIDVAYVKQMPSFEYDLNVEPWPMSMGHCHWRALYYLLELNE